MTTNEAVPVLTFSLGEQLFALTVEEVVEVAAMVELAKVPGAPPEMLGVANRHGKPLTVVDLRKVFGISDAVVDASTLFIVAHFGSRSLALVVDEVHQVEYIPIDQVGFTLTAGKYIRGIISYKERLIQLIALAPLLGTYVSGVAEVVLDDTH